MKNWLYFYHTFLNKNFLDKAMAPSSFVTTSPKTRLSILCNDFDSVLCVVKENEESLVAFRVTNDFPDSVYKWSCVH